MRDGEYANREQGCRTVGEKREEEKREKREKTGIYRRWEEGGRVWVVCLFWGERERESEETRGRSEDEGAWVVGGNTDPSP